MDCEEAGPKEWQPQRQVTASTFVAKADELEYGTRVVLFVRVSTRSQAYHRNYAANLAKLNAVACQLGLNVVGVDATCCSGWDPEESLKYAAALARQHRATILALTTDRLLRARSYRSGEHAEDQPNAEEWAHLSRLYHDINFATVQNPDASNAAMGGLQKRIGKAARRKPKSSRLTVDQWVQKKLRLSVFQLHENYGLGLKRLKRMFRFVPYTTLARWLDDWKN